MDGRFVSRIRRELAVFFFSHVQHLFTIIGKVLRKLEQVTRQHAALQSARMVWADGARLAWLGHPLTLQRSASVKDLARYPWVLARRWELERKALDDLFAQAGQPAIEAQVETTSWQGATSDVYINAHLAYLAWLSKASEVTGRSPLSRVSEPPAAIGYRAVLRPFS